MFSTPRSAFPPHLCAVAAADGSAAADFVIAVSGGGGGDGGDGLRGSLVWVGLCSVCEKVFYGTVVEKSEN